LAKKPKEPKAPKAPQAKDPKPGDNLTAEQLQALHFSQHVPSYKKALEAKKLADAALKNVCKVIKADGGSVEAVKLTLSLATPEGEQAFRDTMEMHKQVAVWNGLGIQLDMDFGEREPAEDRAYGEGKRAGMRGDRASPPYDPSTRQAQRWLEGHADGNAILATDGFKQLRAPAPAEGASAAH
jgi:hypothetical protein